MFFYKMLAWCQEDQSNLKIQIKIILKWPLAPQNSKWESFETKPFAYSIHQD